MKGIFELQILKKEWINFQARALDDYERIDQIFTNNKINENNRDYPELKEIGEKYNDLFWRSERIFKEFDIKEEIQPKHISFYPDYDSTSGWFFQKGKVFATLRSMNDECNKALALIDNLCFNIEFAPEKEKELASLKKEVEENIKPRLPLYALDLNQALESFRKNALLGSVLITGRVVDVIIDKLQKEIAKEKGIKIEDIKLNGVSEFLQEKTGEIEFPLITKAIKLWRNKFSHNIGIYPEIEECIIMISGVVNLIKKEEVIKLLTSP